MPEPDRILRPAEVDKKTGLSRTTRWRLENRNDFPKRIKISDKTIGYLQSEVERWIQDRVRVSRQQPPTRLAITPLKPRNRGRASGDQ